MGISQALILRQFEREGLTHLPLSMAWEMKQTQAPSPGNMEGELLLPVWFWNLVKCKMLSLFQFSHKEAYLSMLSLPALLPH